MSGTQVKPEWRDRRAADSGLIILTVCQLEISIYEWLTNELLMQTHQSTLHILLLLLPQLNLWIFGRTYDITYNHEQ